MRRHSIALAIALAISACAPILPMQKAELPMQTPTFALAISTPTPTPLPTQEKETAEVTAYQSLHVRTQPLGKVIDYLYHGDTVTILDCRDGWAQIRWETGRAWVNADYLSDNMCKE
jgi:hypothetical protein